MSSMSILRHTPQQTTNTSTTRGRQNKQPPHTTTARPCARPPTYATAHEPNTSQRASNPHIHNNILITYAPSLSTMVNQW